MSLMAQKQDNVVNLAERQRVKRRQVLEQLFTEHSAALRAFLAARLGSRDDLDDLVQEVYLKVAGIEELSERVASNRGSFRAYLFTVGHNLVYDLWRRRSLHHAYTREQRDMEQHSVNEATPDTILAAREELALVKREIMTMPPVWQQVFLLNRVELMSYREIAEQMNISVKQVEKYMSKSLARIRAAVRRAREGKLQETENA